LPGDPQVVARLLSAGRINLSSVVMPSALHSRASVARFFLTAFLGVAIDLWTKHLAFVNLAVPITEPDGSTHLYSRAPYTLIPGWIEFEFTANHGAVFGLGQGMRTLFLIASVGASAFLIYLFIHSGRKWFYQILLGMLLAGVLGNLYDRFRYGYVRDMIHALPAWPSAFRWIFNVADSLLCVGVGLMVIYSFIPPQTHSEDAKPAPRSQPIED
jgi:signal peptidase II